MVLSNNTTRYERLETSEDAKSDPDSNLDSARNSLASERLQRSSSHGSLPSSVNSATAFFANKLSERRTSGRRFTVANTIEGAEFELGDEIGDNERAPMAPYPTLSPSATALSEVCPTCVGTIGFEVAVALLILANISFVLIDLHNVLMHHQSAGADKTERLSVCEHRMMQQFCSSLPFLYGFELLLRVSHLLQERYLFGWRIPQSRSPRLDVEENKCDDTRTNACLGVDILTAFVWLSLRYGLLSIDGFGLGSSGWLVCVGVLRLARLCWVLNLLAPAARDAMIELEWVESPEFQWLVAFVILLNALVMGFEMDVPSPLWQVVNQAILLFFIFELFVRMRVVRWRVFFAESPDLMWNYLDIGIVLISIFDLWVWALIEMWQGHRNSMGVGNLMMLGRVFRLLRILRLLRLFRAFRPLHALAICVTQAMQSIFWVLVLTMVAIYAVAILTTRMVGHALLVSDPDHVPKETRALFATIWDSMFTLFSVMNGEQWDRLYPLFDIVPMTKPFFLVFIIGSSWALLSILTGVISDHMVVVRESDELKNEEEQELRLQWLQSQLRSVFHSADTNGTGSLNREEYLDLLHSPYHVRKLQEVANVSASDFAMMFDLLDVDGSNELEWEEFLHGFDWLNDQITGKSLLKIRHAIFAQVAKLQSTMTEASQAVDNLSASEEQHYNRLQECLEGAMLAKQKLKEAQELKKEAELSRDEARWELDDLMANGGIKSPLLVKKDSLDSCRAQF